VSVQREWGVMQLTTASAIPPPHPQHATCMRAALSSRPFSILFV
jgi:hypothetical protein